MGKASTRIAEGKKSHWHNEVKNQKQKQNKQKKQHTLTCNFGCAISDIVHCDSSCDEEISEVFFVRHITWFEVGSEGLGGRGGVLAIEDLYHLNMPACADVHFQACEVRHILSWLSQLRDNTM